MVYELEVDGRTVEIGAVSMGNPHAILDVPDVDIAPVAELGPRIEHHPRFPKRANVGFASWQDRKPCACGSGSAVPARPWPAAPAPAPPWSGGGCRLAGWDVEVELRGGRLVVSWQGEGEPVWMTRSGGQPGL